MNAVSFWYPTIQAEKVLVIRISTIIFCIGNLPEIDFSEHITSQLNPRILWSYFLRFSALWNLFRGHCVSIETSLLERTIGRIQWRQCFYNRKNGNKARRDREVEEHNCHLYRTKAVSDFSFDLIGKSTHSLSDVIPHHSAYKMILNCYHLSVEEVNEKLKSMNIETI